MTDPPFRTPGGIEVPAVTADEMRTVDRIAVEDVGVELLEMIENAGRTLAWHVRNIDVDPVLVVVGGGGNSGGGLACALHLVNHDQPVEVVIDLEPEELGEAAFQRLATGKPNVTLNRLSAEDMTATMGSIKKMLMIGTLFAAVGYLLILGALFLELTQFHPLRENFFSEFSAYRLTGGGSERTSAELNQQHATIHKFPPTLLWLTLGGIGHILLGIFIVLAAIVQALSMMPHRPSHELERA